MKTLSPSGKVVISSSEKFFHKGEPLGRSSGSELLVEFNLDEDADMGQVIRRFLETKKRLDDAVLVSEYLRGTLSPGELKERRALLRDRYERALKLDPQENFDDA